MARDTTDTTPISSRDELVRWFEQGSKPADSFRIGIEHEKFPFYRDRLTPVPYEAASAGGRGGIRALLDGLRERQGWQAIEEDGRPIGLSNDDVGGAISLEPGGQFELSGAPLRTLHEAEVELAEHLGNLKAVAEPLGIGFPGPRRKPDLDLGRDPRDA